MNRRLYRCRHDRRIAGVASGVAEYFDLDPSLVRVLWLVSIFFGAVTLLLYIGMWIIVPQEPLTDAEIAADASRAAARPAGATGAAGVAGHYHRTSGESRWSLWIGLILLLCGALALVDVVAPGWAASRYFWPLLLVGAGGILLAMAIRRPSIATSPQGPMAPQAAVAPQSPMARQAPVAPPAQSLAPTEPSEPTQPTEPDQS